METIPLQQNKVHKSHFRLQKCNFVQTRHLIKNQYYLAPLISIEPDYTVSHQLLHFNKKICLNNLKIVKTWKSSYFQLNWELPNSNENFNIFNMNFKLHFSFCLLGFFIS